MGFLQEAAAGKRFDRRTLLARAGQAGLGMGALALVGCGDDSGSKADTATQVPGTIASATRTPEVPVGKEGILSIGNFQFEAQQWKEKPSDKEGWKYVSVKGRLRNKGGNVSNLQEGTYNYNVDSRGVVEHRVSGSNENIFSTTKLYFLSNDGRDMYRIPNPVFGQALTPTPPGFSTDFSVEASVPNIQDKYKLVAETYTSPYSTTPQTFSINKGDTVKNSPVASEPAKIVDYNTSFTVPNWGIVNFANNFFTEQTPNQPSTKSWLTQLQIKNTSGQDIDSRDISTYIFLSSGNAIQGAISRQTVPPGFTKDLRVNLSQGEDNFQTIIKNGIFVTFAKNSWIAWQLP